MHTPCLFTGIDHVSHRPVGEYPGHLPSEMNKFQPSRKTSEQTPSSSEVDWHLSRVDNKRTGFQEERSGVKGFEDRVLGNSRLAV